MKFIKYVNDQKIIIFIYIFFSLLIFLTLCAFHIRLTLLYAFIFLQSLLGIILFLYRYIRIYTFYNQLTHYISHLDEAYYVIEMMKEPHFYEGEIIYNSLYTINKSMIEKINSYKKNIDDFKEYVEMWIHEVKLPLSSLTLMAFNDHNINYKHQISRLDNNIEQILYYLRSENTEKDFLIKDINLNEIITKLALKYKDELLMHKIDFNVNVSPINVKSDGKWLLFILSQIINNAIKYKRDNGYIEIKTIDNDDHVILQIEDHGIGINDIDLPRVFDKTFTGENGHNYSKSTGMGLYIVKKLCLKLGHNVTIESKVNHFTKVNIIFNKFDYFNTLSPNN